MLVSAETGGNLSPAKPVVKVKTAFISKVSKVIHSDDANRGRASEFGRLSTTPESLKSNGCSLGDNLGPSMYEARSGLLFSDILSYRILRVMTCFLNANLTPFPLFHVKLFDVTLFDATLSL